MHLQGAAHPINAGQTFVQSIQLKSMDLIDHEEIQQEDMIYPWLANGSMSDNNAFENDIPSDALDAMADLAYEQEQAMREEWDEDPGYQLPQQTNELPSH